MAKGAITRRYFATALAGLCGTTLMAACVSTDSQTDAAATTDYETDYGISELYTQADMDAAIEIILAEFNTWTGCTMKRIAFTDDATCSAELAYANSMRDEGSSEFAQAIVFSSDFHSPSVKDAEGTAWNPDSDYEGWTWILAREGADSSWQLISWGYA